MLSADLTPCVIRMTRTLSVVCFFYDLEGFVGHGNAYLNKKKYRKYFCLHLDGLRLINIWFPNNTPPAGGNLLCVGVWVGWPTRWIERLPVMVTTVTQRATFRSGGVSNHKPSAPCHTYTTNCHSKIAINNCWRSYAVRNFQRRQLDLSRWFSVPWACYIDFIKWRARRDSTPCPLPLEGRPANITGP